jgi:hypothetical protein
MQKMMRIGWLMLCAIIGTAFDVHAQPLQGAFRLTGGQYGQSPITTQRLNEEQVIKLFANGYWISSFVNKADGKMNGTGGGTFTTTADVYKEQLLFYSWDSTAAGKSYQFSYVRRGNTYQQKGTINSEKYKDFLIDETFETIKPMQPLQHSGLEGAWWLEQATWHDGVLGQGKYAQMASLKLYVYPRFATAVFNKVTGAFMGATGGTYQYDGTTLTEVLDYSTWGMKLNEPLSIKIALPAQDRYQQNWQGSTEVWRKVRHE